MLAPPNSQLPFLNSSSKFNNINRYIAFCVQAIGFILLNDIGGRRTFWSFWL